MIYDDNLRLPDIPGFEGFPQRLIDELPGPVFLKAPDGKIIMANKAFCAVVACENASLRGNKIGDFLSVELAQQFELHDLELLKDQGVQKYELRIRLPKGGLCDYAFQKSLLYNDAQELVGIFCSMTDLTRQRTAERASEEAQEASVIASAMLHKIRSGIVIVDTDLKVLNSNPGFAHLMGGDIEELYEAVPGLKGAGLAELVPDAIHRMFVSLMNSGENMLERDLRYQNKLIHVSVITIYKHRVVGALIRDMSAPALMREEIVSRAQRVNKHNMETVQKIAFLLGENASSMEELLHSIIESYNYGEEDQDE